MTPPDPEDEDGKGARMNSQVIRSLNSLAILVFGVGSVITLALTHVIADGETVAALSSIMSAAMGTHALNRKGDF